MIDSSSPPEPKHTVFPSFVGHDERCLFCGQKGKVGLEPGFMLMVKLKNGKQKHIHVFCSGAVSQELVKSKREKKIDAIIPQVCAGPEDTPNVEEYLRQGVAWAGVFFQRGDIDDAFALIGVSPPEIELGLQDAVLRIRRRNRR